MVSIIIPVYNSQDTLSKCINSILCQTYNNLEIIIVNDGSTDNSLKLCQTYTDPRILVVNSLHGGVSAARNIGLSYTKGEYLLFLDSDDYYSNAGVITSLMGKTADLVIGGYIDDYFKKDKFKDYIKKYLIRPNRYMLFARVWDKLFKRSIIKENHISFNLIMDKHEDIDFVFQYLRYCEDVLVINENICCHHRTNYGLEMKITDSFVDIEALLESADYYKFPKEITNHTRVSLMIVEIVRAYRLFFWEHYAFNKRILNNYKVRESLKDYQKLSGNSVILPNLMKLRFCLLLTIISRIKGRKRYG